MLESGNKIQNIRKKQQHKFKWSKSLDRFQIKDFRLEVKSAGMEFRSTFQHKFVAPLSRKYLYML